MYLEKPLQRECKVSGILSFILHISKIAGMAPIKIERVRGGWIISVSRVWYIYNIILAIISVTLASHFTFDGRDGIVDGYESSSNTGYMRIAVILQWMVFIIAIFIVAAYGYHRLNHTIDCIFQLDQINKKLNHLFGITPTSEIKTWFTVILLMVHGYCAVLMEYVPYLGELIAINNTLPFSSCSFAAFFLNLLQLQLLALQFSLVCMQLVSTQKRLNNSLKEILKEACNDASTKPDLNPQHVLIDNDFRINMCNQRSYQHLARHKVRKDSSRDGQIVNQLADIYSTLCGIIEQLNEAHGISLIMLLVFIQSHTVNAPYFVVSLLYRSQTEIPVLKACAVFAFCSLCISLLVTVTEPCHRSHYQLHLTKKLINQLIRYTPRDSAGYYELKKFKRHVFLNPVRFRPMHLLTFNRSLIVAVLSTVVTYLSVVINL